MRKIIYCALALAIIVGPTRAHAAQSIAAGEALDAFERLLKITRGADAMGSHWQVREESWREALETWERASSSLPARVRGLKRCAVPLVTARRMIERADALFRQARGTTDAFGAAELLARHERLLKQADARLLRAERCYGSVRDGYLKGARVR